MCLATLGQPCLALGRLLTPSKMRIANEDKISVTDSPNSHMSKGRKTKPTLIAKKILHVTKNNMAAIPKTILISLMH